MMGVMRRKLTNLLILAVLAIMLIQGLPSAGPVHEQAREAMEPWLDAAGLWQKPWALFAPVVVKRNGRVSAAFEDASGVVIRWDSPLMTDLSVAKRFTTFREDGFFMRIRNDTYAGAWESVAEALARKEFPMDAPGTKLVKTTLWRRWWDVPPPGSGLPPPEEQWYQIYQKEHQP